MTDQKIIDEIVHSCCKSVCITGGEPLLESDTCDIIQELHERGVSIYLSTNGTKYMEQKGKLEKFIAKLSLPLDGYDEKSNGINGRHIFSQGSKDESFLAVKEILEYYEHTPHDFAIKIGTVLTKKNADIETFKKMYNFLKNYSIDMWKIYEIIPEGRGIEHSEDLVLTNDELDDFIMVDEED